MNEKLERAKVKLEKLFAAAAVSFIVLPTITACVLTFLLWDNKKFTILQFPLHLLTIYAETKALIYDEAYEKNFRDAMLLVESVLEAVPELVINLYVLSLCGEKIRALQYFSAMASLLTICGAVTKVRDQDEINKTFFFTFMYRACMITARILALTYFIFLLEYWTFLFVAIHFSIFIFLNWKVVKNGKQDNFQDRLKYIFVRVPLDSFNCLHVVENLLLLLIPSLVYGISQNCSQQYVETTTLVNATTPSIVATTALHDITTHSGDGIACVFCLFRYFLPVTVAIQICGILFYMGHAARWQQDDMNAGNQGGHKTTDDEISIHSIS